jgi:hypothetical protein
MPDCVSLVQYRTCSGIIRFFHSGTRLTRCRTVCHSSILAFLYICTWTLTWACSIDMDIDIDMNMQYGHGHGHAAWTWTYSMGVCAILLQLYTSTECLKRAYTSPRSFLRICYLRKIMVLIIIYNFYVNSFYLKLI